MMQILLDGFRFVGDAGKATYTIERDGIRGLTVGGVGMRREQADRPAAHGEFSLPGYLTGRAASWSGEIETTSAIEQEYAMRRLSGLLADGKPKRLTLLGASPLWLDVVRTDEPSFSMIQYGRAARYSFEVWAPDPRMFGEVHDFPGGTVAVNRGNFPARPQLIVSGSAAGGYTVTGPGGRRVVVTKALASGAPHTIDFARGGLWINGVRQLRAMTVYQPWEIAPGMPGATATVNNGAALVQRVTDTFV